MTSVNFRQIIERVEEQSHTENGGFSSSFDDCSIKNPTLGYPIFSNLGNDITIFNFKEYLVLKVYVKG